MKISQLKRSNTGTDVVVHVDEDLDEQNRCRIEHDMIRASGIERAQFNNERRHLLIVSYDPALTNSTKILNMVRKHKLHAQLVGGI